MRLRPELALELDDQPAARRSQHPPGAQSQHPPAGSFRPGPVGSLPPPRDSLAGPLSPRLAATSMRPPSAPLPLPPAAPFPTGWLLLGVGFVAAVGAGFLVRDWLSARSKLLIGDDVSSRGHASPNGMVVLHYPSDFRHVLGVEGQVVADRKGYPDETVFVSALGRGEVGADPGPIVDRIVSDLAKPRDMRYRALEKKAGRCLPDKSLEDGVEIAGELTSEAKTAKTWACVFGKFGNVYVVGYTVPADEAGIEEPRLRGMLGRTQVPDPTACIQTKEGFICSPR